MSLKNNKVYKDTLKELAKVRKFSQYCTYKNALINIVYSTEDAELIELLNYYMSRFETIEDLTKRRCFTGAQKMYNETLPWKNRVESYCKGILESGEPEWMVCARANGWGPLA